MLSSLYNWIIGEPNIHQTGLRVLKIPADGSTPHLITLNTIDISTAGNVDCLLNHIPDFRPFWGTREGFHWRDLVQYEVTGQSLAELNGIYWGWKSFALGHIPLSEHTGFCGDAFFAKTPAWEYGADGYAAYEDVSEDFVGSGLLGVALEKLHDR